MVRKRSVGRGLVGQGEELLRVDQIEESSLPRCQSEEGSDEESTVLAHAEPSPGDARRFLTAFGMTFEEGLANSWSLNCSHEDGGR